MNENHSYLQYRILELVIQVEFPGGFVPGLYPRLKPLEEPETPDYFIDFIYTDIAPVLPSQPNWFKIFAGEMLFTPTLVYYRRSNRIIKIEKTLNRVAVYLPLQAQAYVPPEAVMDTALMLLLQDQGYFPLHASGGRLKSNFLFPGKSGCGKSTLAYRLFQCGGSFLADDHVFLRLEDHKIAAHSYIATALLRRNLQDANPDKTIFDFQHHQPGSVVSFLIPDTLIFPQFQPVEIPALQAITAAQAVMLLIPLTLPPQDSAAFARLTALAEQGRCFILHLPQAEEKPEQTKQLLCSI